MNRARSFFFVCLGILCIVASYHLGARSAGAQAPSGVECVNVDGGRGFAVIGGYSYITSGVGTVSRIPVPVPGRTVACLYETVLLDSGQVWVYSEGDGWTLNGTLPFGSATPAQSMSVGQLKAKYATPAGK
jgi:hypothetical protein